MELKLVYKWYLLKTESLLIVPYGIETTVYNPSVLVGILLLIVPYGIETRNRLFGIRYLSLLIVPYGIETRILQLCFVLVGTFNCTLWN